MVPQNIKNCKPLQEFKRLIKVWKLEACPCKYWFYLIKHAPFIEPKQKDQTFMFMDHVNHYRIFNLYINHNQENESRFMSRYTLFRIN